MNSKRARVRMLLGKWGGWTVMLDRLRREQRAARDWLRDEGGETPRELLEKIDCEIDELVRLRSCMAALVGQLPAEEQRVLVLRYESGLSWVQIGMKLNYDERSVRRIETRAVDRISAQIAD